MAGRGRRVTFHGAFSSKSAARRKARARGGVVRRTRVRGDVRYVVMTGKRRRR